MDAFYLTISTISIFFLILILTFFGTLMKNNTNKGAVFPPNASPCPDYWKVNPDSTCSAVIKSEKDGVKTYFNTGSLTLPLNTSGAPYVTSGNTFDPQDIKWSATGKSTVCAQRDWANQNGIIWDGISNCNFC